MTVDTREWVRTHQDADSIVARFEGELDGQWRELVALATMGKGVIVVPAAGLIPVDRGDQVVQAALDLERIIGAMREGGLSLADAGEAWARVLGRITVGEADG